MDLFALQVALIFLPGIIWAKIDSTYAHKGRPTQFELILKAFIFGVTAYVVTFLIYDFYDWEFSLFDVARDPNAQTVNVSLWDEVLIAIIVACVWSVIWLYASNYKILTRCLQTIGATKTYGDEDVWDFVLNSRDAAVEYAHIRDFSKGLTYSGWISVFSQSDTLRELILRNVVVSDLNSGETLYEVPRIYIAREPTDITLEFPYRDEDDKEEELDD